MRLQLDSRRIALRPLYMQIVRSRIPQPVKFGRPTRMPKPVEELCRSCFGSGHDTSWFDPWRRRPRILETHLEVCVFCCKACIGVKSWRRWRLKGTG